MQFAVISFPVQELLMFSYFFSPQKFDDEPKPLSIEGEGLSENEKVEAALAEFKQQSQIKAVAVLAIAFGTFVYLKLQYDADPSTFVGGH